MSIQEQRRKDFEAWLEEDGLDFEWDQRRNCYKNFTCHMAWRAWNAALDSVVIQLPDADEFDIPSGAAPAIRECREAIEAAGLKVAK